MAGETMKVRVKKLHPNAKSPTYATEGSAAFDLYAYGNGVMSEGAITIQTGLAFEIPPGHVMRIYSRSGHGFKGGIRLSNSVGVIDSDYRGEVMVQLVRDRASCVRFVVGHGDRIAQAIIEPIPRIEFEEAEALSVTVRGEGGFGSTGS